MDSEKLTARAADPEPELLDRWFGQCASLKRGADHIEVITSDGISMLALNRGDLYMTLYSPSEELLSIVGPLAASEGLFLRQPENAQKEDLYE